MACVQGMLRGPRAAADCPAHEGHVCYSSLIGALNTMRVRLASAPCASTSGATDLITAGNLRPSSALRGEGREFDRGGVRACASTPLHVPVD